MSNTSSENLGEILYHYTDISGLNSIIQSRKVWASDCRYLNDRKELDHAIKLFLKRFKDDDNKALSLALGWNNLRRAHCVFSMSRSPEVLSQWRSYGDDGRGAAIGFARKYFLGLGKKQDRAIVECVYDNPEGFIDSVIQKCESDIDAIFAIYKQDSAINVFWPELDKQPQHLINLYVELLKLKNPAFKEEKEVRFVMSVPVKDIKTRVSNGLIIPYFEYDFTEKDEEPLWFFMPEIWLGPKSDERNMKALSVFEHLRWIAGDGIKRFDCGYI